MGGGEGGNVLWCSDEAVSLGRVNLGLRVVWPLPVLLPFLAPARMLCLVRVPALSPEVGLYFPCFFSVAWMDFQQCPKKSFVALIPADYLPNRGVRRDGFWWSFGSGCCSPPPTSVMREIFSEFWTILSVSTWCDSWRKNILDSSDPSIYTATNDLILFYQYILGH